MPEELGCGRDRDEHPGHAHRPRLGSCSTPSRDLRGRVLWGWIDRGGELEHSASRPGGSAGGRIPPGSCDDAPVEGSSFPSGHAATAACAVYLASTVLPSPVTAGLWCLVPLTALARVQQGAHHTVDVAAGLCLGVGLGGVLTEAAAGRRVLELAVGPIVSGR